MRKARSFGSPSTRPLALPDFIAFHRTVSYESSWAGQRDAVHRRLKHTAGEIGSYPARLRCNYGGSFPMEDLRPDRSRLAVPPPPEQAACDDSPEWNEGDRNTRSELPSNQTDHVCRPTHITRPWSAMNCDGMRWNAMNRQSRPQFRPTELPAMNWRAKRATIIRAANY